jgi:hypothetical protein
MFPRIVRVQHVSDYILRLTFTDGETGELDFTDKIKGRDGVFTPLQDVDFFKQVQVDAEAGTIVWPNGVDLDPDVLYSEVTDAPLPKLETA